MHLSLLEILMSNMLNRRILRIKAFKVLYGNVLAGGRSLAEAQSQLDISCEATRDLYIYMLGIISPLTKLARERIDVAKAKFNPTEEERNPNMKFAENELAKFFEDDIDFQKIFNKKKFSWEQYDIFLKKILSSIASKDYYAEYMSSPTRSLNEDCKLFIKIYEEEFVESEELEEILEDLCLYWNDDLAYALTHCCKTLKTVAKTNRWELPPLYQSDMKKDTDMDSDKLFVSKLLRLAHARYPEYLEMVNNASIGWDKDRLFLSDVVLVTMGLAEASGFPEIPIKVTINEYVEISKFYGTIKSRSFVNGLLDRLIQTMVQDGRIVKTGKGLL